MFDAANELIARTNLSIQYYFPCLHSVCTCNKLDNGMSGSFLWFYFYNIFIAINGEVLIAAPLMFIYIKHTLLIPTCSLIAMDF